MLGTEMEQWLHDPDIYRSGWGFLLGFYRAALGGGDNYIRDILSVLNDHHVTVKMLEICEQDIDGLDGFTGLNVRGLSDSDVQNIQKAGRDLLPQMAGMLVDAQPKNYKCNYAPAFIRLVSELRTYMAEDTYRSLLQESDNWSETVARLTCSMLPNNAEGDHLMLGIWDNVRCINRKDTGKWVDILGEDISRHSMCMSLQPSLAAADLLATTSDRQLQLMNCIHDWLEKLPKACGAMGKLSVLTPDEALASLFE